jgi:hypothetical protein
MRLFFSCRQHSQHLRLCVFTLDLESAGVPAIDATDLTVLVRWGSTPRPYLERFERVAPPTSGHAVSARCTDAKHFVFPGQIALTRGK